MGFNLIFIKYFRYTKSLAWTNFLIKKSVPIHDFYLRKQDNKIFIRSVNHFFSYGDYPVFFDGYNDYCSKFVDNGIQFIFENNNMFLKINDITIKVETLEELFIINEVFLENMYKIESKSDYIAIDIGMNVGITSLYLSHFENIKKIYAFEPLRPTFDCAKVNLMLNQKYLPKIQASNFGLSNKNQIVEVIFNPLSKGNVGIKNSEIKTVAEKHVQKIELKEASNSLQEIIKNHPEAKFMVKLDCEGSEYDIVENLSGASMLPLFNIFMIEWHNMKGYKSRLINLINVFKDNNFLVLTIGSLDSGTGMIYCLNNN